MTDQIPDTDGLARARDPLEVAALYDRVEALQENSNRYLIAHAMRLLTLEAKLAGTLDVQRDVLVLMRDMAQRTQALEALVLAICPAGYLPLAEVQRLRDRVASLGRMGGDGVSDAGGGFGVRERGEKPPRPVQPACARVHRENR